MKDFRSLKVWEKAHQLALALYTVTASFPRQEAYGLASQIRRAASSIPSNIAEGCGREGDPELARFCIIARGSATELEYQLLLARDLKLIQAKDYEKLSAQTVEIKRMLTVFVQKLTLNADQARQPNRPLWLRPPAALVRISGVWPWVRLHRSLEMLFVVTGGER